MAGRFLRVLILSFLSIAGSVSASEYSNGNTINGEGYDILVPSLPNSSGISYNTFSAFKVDGKSLRIINLKENNPNGTAADLIVIHSDQLLLANEIELLGKKADILIVGNTATGLIRCTNCGFKNFGRVTIANAEYSGFSTDMVNVGELTALGGLIEINNLSAPGVDSVELVAGIVSIAGQVTTQLWANPHPEGGYEIGDSGSLVVGSGGVNFYIGEGLVYDYDRMQIMHAPAINLAPVTLNGSIRSASINITSLAPLNVLSDIDTSSDLLSTSFYRDNFNVPSESINIKSLGDEGLLSIVGTLKSRLISLRSYANTDIVGVLKAAAIEIVSKTRVENTGKILEGTVEIASDTFFNSGHIEAKAVEIIAQKRIHNGYGGKILADDIVIISKSGSVINGSKLPFIFANDKWEENQTIASTDNLSFDSGYYEGIDESQGQRSSSLSGFIVGKRVAIKGINVRNINPYYVFKSSGEDWSNGIPINPLRASQVAIRASERLLIEAASVFENASSIAGVQEWGGLFQIVARNVINERYRVQIALDTYRDSIVDLPDGVSGYEEGVSSELVIYSPPGTLFSMGDYYAGGYSFYNKMSFFEVYGDAYLDVRFTKTSGVKIQEARFHTYTNIFYDCDTACYPVGSTIVENYNREYFFKEEEDTLFFVHGNTFAKNLVVKNEESMNGFESPVLDFIESKFDESFEGVEHEYIVSHDVLFRPADDLYWGEKSRVGGTSFDIDKVTQIPFQRGVIDHSGDSERNFTVTWATSSYEGVYIDHSDDKVRVSYGRKTLDESDPENVVVTYEDCSSTAKINKKIKQRPRLYSAYIARNVYGWNYQTALGHYALTGGEPGSGFGSVSPSEVSLENRALGAEDQWALQGVYDPYYMNGYNFLENVSLGRREDDEVEWENLPKTVFDYENASVSCSNKVTKTYSFWDSVVEFVEGLKQSLVEMLDRLIDWWEE